jgi:oligopeptide/dipeptide ABC transporter ATP-binding protein
MSSVIEEISTFLRAAHGTPPLFQLQEVSVRFALGGVPFFALNKVSLTGYKKETIGIIGESGSGKSTLAKTLLFFQKPVEGRVLFRQRDFASLSKKELRLERKGIQMIFQDPDASLNPKLTVFDHLKEPLQIHGSYTKSQLLQEVIGLLEMVQLTDEFLYKYPHQLSGGQKQRVSIARALSVKPELLVCDEPLASLDISVSNQIVHLLRDLQLQKGISYLFITHDLAFLKQIAHQVVVLYLGNIVEMASADVFFRSPMHPYSKALLASAPVADPRREKQKVRVCLQGEIPSVLSPPSGCPFHTRCPIAQELCRKRKPLLQEEAPEHFVACHFASNPTSY